MLHILCSTVQHMCNATKPCTSGWAKELFPGCPETEPITDTGTTVLFHLVATDPPTIDDFRSQRELQPDKHFEDVSECVTRSLSNWLDYSKCNSLRKNRRHRPKRIARVQLAPDSGVIWTRDDGHVSWWPCGAFDAVSASTIVG